MAAELGSTDIADEFAIVGEVRAGLPTSEAFRKLAERVEVEDVKTLAAVMIQSATLGAPMSKTLNRTRRRRERDAVCSWKNMRVR